jgi:hypothetical protein
VIAAAPPDVPRLELQKWNQAFRMYVSLITLAQQEEYEIINMDKCSSEGFDTVDPASVALEACFYKQYTNGSYAYWIKKPGECLPSYLQLLLTRSFKATGFSGSVFGVVRDTNDVAGDRKSSTRAALWCQQLQCRCRVCNYTT